MSFVLGTFHHRPGMVIVCRSDSARMVSIGSLYSEESEHEPIVVYAKAVLGFTPKAQPMRLVQYATWRPKNRLTLEQVAAHGDWS